MSRKKDWEIEEALGILEVVLEAVLEVVWDIREDVEDVQGGLGRILGRGCRTRTGD